MTVQRGVSTGQVQLEEIPVTRGGKSRDIDIEVQTGYIVNIDLTSLLK